MEMETQIFGKYMFAGPLLTREHRAAWVKRALLGPCLVYHTLVPIKLSWSMIISSFPEQVLYLISFRQLEEGSKVLFESFVYWK